MGAGEGVELLDGGGDVPRAGGCDGTVIVVEVVGLAGRGVGAGRVVTGGRVSTGGRRTGGGVVVDGGGVGTVGDGVEGTVGVGTDGAGTVGVVTVGTGTVGTVTLTVGTAAFPSWASRCAAAKPPTAPIRQNSLPNHFIRRRPPVRGVCTYNAWTLQRDAPSLGPVLALLRRCGLRRRGRLVRVVVPGMVVPGIVVVVACVSIRRVRRTSREHRLDLVHQRHRRLPFEGERRS